MSIEAILNVEADRLAGKYQDKLGAYSPITHMYPSSQAILEINGMTVTSNIRHHLIKAYAEPKYMRYLQRKKGEQKDSTNDGMEMFGPTLNLSKFLLKSIKIVDLNLPN